MRRFPRSETEDEKFAYAVSLALVIYYYVIICFWCCLRACVRVPCAAWGEWVPTVIVVVVVGCLSGRVAGATRLGV